MRAPEDRGIEQVEELFQGAALRLAFDGGRHHGDNAVVDGGKANILLIDQ